MTGRRRRAAVHGAGRCVGRAGRCVRRLDRDVRAVVIEAAAGVVEPVIRHELLDLQRALGAGHVRGQRHGHVAAVIECLLNAFRQLPAHGNFRAFQRGPGSDGVNLDKR